MEAALESRDSMQKEGKVPKQADLWGGVLRQGQGVLFKASRA